jgi:hypothetical protein
MKQKLKSLLMLATVAGMSLAAPATVLAQEILAKVSVSGTMYEQSTNTTDNNLTTATKAPTKISLTTATLLKQLALDEYSEQNWTASNFPANASLVFNGTGFEVDQGTNQLVDVSDILTWTVSGHNDVSTSSFSDANGQGSPPYAQTDYFLATVVYNGSNFTGALNFSVTGLATVTGKATNPNSRTGNFTQSASLSLQDGTGEGTITTNYTPFVLTGFTISAGGSVPENNGSGSDE